MLNIERLEAVQNLFGFGGTGVPAREAQARRPVPPSLDQQVLK